MEEDDEKDNRWRRERRDNNRIPVDDWKARSNLPDGWISKENMPHGRRFHELEPSKNTYEVSYAPTEQEAVYNKHDDIEIDNEDDLKRLITDTVYQEGNIDVDPYNAVVDTGCPKTVCGKPFMDAFIASKGENEMVRRKYEDQNFKFGDGKVYKSNLSHEISVDIGGFKTTIETSVVDVNIPLLLGMDYLKRWGIVIDTGKDELYIRMARKTFKIDSSQSNHWKLPIQNGRTLHKQAHRLVLSVELCDLNDRDLRKHILKTHKNLAHKSEGHMTRLFRMAGKASTRTRKIIKDVCDKCNICNFFRKTRPRPTVAMAKANTPNEVVSLDLKEMREHKCHILYCVDKFSGYIKAAVIKNKEPETVLKALTRIWVREGPGHPSKGWFSDNGGEFRNAIMMEAAAKLGLRIFLTAGNSPWSNGKNERNPYSCDMTISKLLADDKKLTLTEALSHAIYAHIYK